MNPHRALKRRSRMLLHQRLSEPVWYVKAMGEEPIATTVRLHLQFDRTGALMRDQYAEREEIDPKLVFLTPIAPVRNAYVVTEDMGVWFVDVTQPRDDTTIIARVNPASDRDLDTLGLTPDTPWYGLAPVAVEDLPHG